MSYPLIRYVWLAALRDRLLMTLLLMIAAGAGLGAFLGASALTEQESFSTVFGAGGLRLLGMTGIVLFVCFYLRRAFESKDVEFMLSRPISRMTYLLSHVAAFVVLAVVVAAAVTGALLLTGRPHLAGLGVWGASIAAEYAMMSVVALFFSIVLSSAAGSALASFGVYVLARMIGVLIGIARMPAENMLFSVLNNVIELISVVVPRFDLMGQTSWLVYGLEGAGGFALRENAGHLAYWLTQFVGAGGFILLQTAVFIGLLIAASAHDFLRREF